MTPQELKNSILQLAIQGKLVDQRPEEGTGKELLEKILRDRAAETTKQTRTTGKAKVKSRVASRASSVSSVSSVPVVPPIPDDEKPFDIPESWEWVRLGDMCEMYTGNSISEGEKRTKYEGRKEGLDYIGTKDVSFKQTICYNNGVRIPFDKEIDFRKARAGAILLCIEGGSAGKKIAILDRDVCFGNKLCMFMPRMLLNTYLFFFLQSMEFRKVFSENMTGIIGGVSIKKLKEIMVPIPPLAEQKRIVAKIEELLPLIDRYEKAWSKLEDFNKRFPVDMQKSVLQMAIQGKLVDQRPEEGTGKELLEKILTDRTHKTTKQTRTTGKAKVKSRVASRVSSVSSVSSVPVVPPIPDDEKPFDIPESWVWVRLGDVASVLGGKRIPAGRQLTTENTGHIYIRVSDMKNDGVNMERLMYVPSDIYPSISRYIIKKEDVYITVAGTIGRIGKIPAELDGANLTENADRLVFEGIDQEWLIQCLKSALVQTQILECTTKVGQPKLAIKRIQDLVVPLPPLAEQKRIVAKLEEILPLCERLK